MTKEVAKKQSEEVGIANVMEEDSGQGLQGIGVDDLAMPFMKILQKGSPECDKEDPLYNPEASAGLFINSVSGKLYGDFVCIPCAYEKQYLEWKPKTAGGGLEAIHDVPTGLSLLATCTRNEKKKDVLPNGNILVTSAMHYVGIRIGNDVEFAIMAMSSTGLKKSRRWNSVMSSIKLDGKNGKYTPPIFGHQYQIETIGESNNDGSWYNWKIELLGLVDDVSVYVKCREFSKSILEGRVRASTSEDGVPF
jgi:hypothetical protein